jgi:hypothetical protein
LVVARAYLLAAVPVYLLAAVLVYLLAVALAYPSAHPYPLDVVYELDAGCLYRLGTA